jgi:proteasome lid subunit RPN8/RPN11
MTVNTPFHKVYIRAKALQVVKYLIAKATKEISFLGTVEETDWGPVITEVFLPKQKNTGVHTDMDDAAVMNLMIELAQEGKGREGMLRAWIHSHVDMPCNWSDMDTDTMRKLKNPKYSVSIVMNKKGEYRCRIDIYEPYHISMDEVPLEVWIPKYDVKADCDRLFDQNVDEKYVYQPVTHGGYGSFGRDDDEDRFNSNGWFDKGGGWHNLADRGAARDTGTGHRGSSGTSTGTTGTGTGNGVDAKKTPDPNDKRFPKMFKGVLYENSDDVEEGVMTGVLRIDDYVEILFPDLAKDATVGTVADPSGKAASA